MAKLYTLAMSPATTIRQPNRHRAAVLCLALLCGVGGLARAAEPDWPALIAALHGSEPEAAEASLASALRALDTTTPTAELYHQVAALVDYQEVGRRPHPERASLSLPRHGIAALAQALRYRWDLREAVDILNRSATPLAKATQTAMQRAALRHWLQQADEAQFEDFLARHDPAALASDEALLLAVLARRPRLRWWQAVADYGGSGQALAALQRARAALDPADYRQLLQRAAANPRLANGAARLRGRWAQSDVSTAGELRQALSQASLDQTLIDAALASEWPDLADLLAARLREPAAAPAAAYGLWRLRSPTALAALRRYRNDPAAIPHLRAEIGRWLRD